MRTGVQARLRAHDRSAINDGGGAERPIALQAKEPVMPSRRDLAALGALALTGGLAPAPDGFADAAEATPARLKTRLFNLRDGASPDRARDIMTQMKDLAASPEFDGFLLGRNFIPTPFPARFEWIYMIQIKGVSGARPGPGYRAFKRLSEVLSLLCVNEVECALAAPLAPRFADAAGIKVRHTVMFDFKADASIAAQARNVAAIRAMGSLPMVQQYLVRKSAPSRPGSSAMQWQVIGDFASVDDYRAYSNAPVHLAIRDDFKANTSRVAFLDVEL